MKVFVRAHYLREREELEHAGATAAIFEEAEAAVALSRLVLRDAGAGRDRIDRAVRDIRMRLILENVNNLQAQSVRNIMIPWTRVRRLSLSAGLDDVRRQLGEQPFSRWPVVDQRGTPAGYLLAKDLIALNSSGGEWTTLIRPLIEVGPNEDLETTLNQFQTEGATICVVKDGDNAIGIVTIEDIIERVIGRIEDEYPRHAKVLLQDILISDAQLLHLSGRTADEAITEMAAHIPPGVIPADVDVAALAITRERELSTHIGAGVAIPHARCPDLSQPIVVFARSDEGVEFGGPTGGPVTLLFLLITPSDQPDLQVLLLSQIASIAGHADQRKRLGEATSTAEIAKILTISEDH